MRLIRKNFISPVEMKLLQQNIMLQAMSSEAVINQEIITPRPAVLNHNIEKIAKPLPIIHPMDIKTTAILLLSFYLY
ncbi:hypothetical protein ACH24_02110 [Francisella persica ATCC VR-331]|uniref:Uncharacterized protein n=1 Tax=Francisella persica ATCC VR-331 TaxID=1086726 RepID=A0AAC8VDD6_9GAMM|nr:hypothetical protein ACH24_02110 [Francisella persica ATCC VR-331]ANH77853.1 hypothetical protein FSC845_04940 [Francisella persica ATCC VR-331]